LPLLIWPQVWCRPVNFGIRKYRPASAAAKNRIANTTLRRVTGPVAVMFGPSERSASASDSGVRSNPVAGSSAVAGSSCRSRIG